MKQLERIYVRTKQFQQTLPQKCAKFMNKIHKIVILIRPMHVPWSTDVYNDALHKTV